MEDTEVSLDGRQVREGVYKCYAMKKEEERCDSAKYKLVS